MVHPANDSIRLEPQYLDPSDDSYLYRRQGNAITNFSRVLPDPQSELAQQVVKNPYSFDFLSLGKQALERDLESALIQHIREFLLELGVGFPL